MHITGRAKEILSVGSSHNFFSTEAKETSARKAEVRNPQARERGWGLLAEGQPAPPHQLKGLGISAVSFPSWARGRAPAAKRFSCVLSVQSGLSPGSLVLFLVKARAIKKQLRQLPRLPQWTLRHLSDVRARASKAQLSRITPRLCHRMLRLINSRKTERNPPVCKYR